MKKPVKSISVGAEGEVNKPITDEQRRKLRDYAAMELGRLVMSGAYTLAERVDSGTPHPIDIPDEDMNVDGLVAAAVRIAQQRTAWLRRLRQAIQAQDREQERMLAELLCGLREEDSHEEGNPASPRLN